MAHKLKIRKRLTLEFLGDEWKDCYLDFKPVSPDEIVKMSLLPDLETESKTKMRDYKYMCDLVTKHFDSGRVLTDEGIVEADAEDLRSNDKTILDKASALIMGDPDPNSSTPSTN